MVVSSNTKTVRVGVENPTAHPCPPLFQAIISEVHSHLADKLQLQDPTSRAVSGAVLWDCDSQSIETKIEVVSFRDVLNQVLLHVYRFKPSEISDPNLMAVETLRHLNRLVTLRQNAPSNFFGGRSSNVVLSRTSLRNVDSTTAEVIHRAYHYLGSYRGDGIHLGLYDESSQGNGRLLLIATLSQCDLLHFKDSFPPDITTTNEVLVLSRLFAFDWCPRNTVSYGLGRVFSWMRERHPQVKLLISYLDPNIGFLGSVYKATNWVRFGREHKQRYLYLDSNYVTDRSMIDAYGTADLKKLRPELGGRVTSSRLSLKPLQIYAYFLHPLMRTRYAEGFDYDFRPPAELVGEQSDSLVY